MFEDLQHFNSPIFSYILFDLLLYYCLFVQWDHVTLSGTSLVAAITSSHYDDVILVICIVQISHHAVECIYSRNMFTKYAPFSVCVARIDDKKGV